MKKDYWKCRLFGHKWEIVYIKKEEKWKFVGAYCGRWQCYLGHEELLDFIKKHAPIVNSYVERYFN